MLVLSALPGSAQAATKIGHWNFDVSGDRWNDSSTTGNDMTAWSGHTTPNTGVAGAPDLGNGISCTKTTPHGMKASGSTAYWNIYDAADTFTAMLWFRSADAIPDNTSGHMFMRGASAATDGTGNRNWGIWLKDASTWPDDNVITGFLVDQAGTPDFDLQSPWDAAGRVWVTDNVWHHVAMVADGSTLRFYLDGDPLASRGYSGVPMSLQWTIATICDSEGGGAYTGSLDDIQLWDGVLTPALIHSEWSGITVTDNQAGASAWQNAAGALYDVDFTDRHTATNTDIQTTAYTGTGRTGTMMQGWTTQLTFNGSRTGNWALTAATFGALAEGTNYISVRGANSLPRTEERTDAFYVRKDTSLPTNPTTLNDGTGADIAYQTASATVFDVNYSGAGDVTSGLQNFAYCVSTINSVSPSCLAGTSGTTTSMTSASATASSPVADGTTVYFCVRARDWANNLATGYSCTNGVRVDVTPPNNPAQSGVMDLDLTWTADRDWGTSTTALTASWFSGGDPGSGVRDYSACFSTVNTGCTPIAGTTQVDGNTTRNLSATATGMTPGTQYFFCVRTYNNAGTPAVAWQCSDGFRIDTTGPTNPTQANIFDLDLTWTADVDWGSSTTALRASWNAGADAESGVRDYSGCFSTVNTGCTAIAGTAQVNGNTSRTMSATATGMTPGTLYYVCVLTYNWSGIAAGSWQCSDGFRIDDTAPSNPTQANVFDLDLTWTADVDWGTSTTALTASWNAGADAESGVRDYSGCFSTVNTGCTAIAGTSQVNGITSFTMSATATGMTPETWYYVCVLTHNEAGAPAAAWQCSDGFRIDTAPPTAPNVPNDGTAADIDSQTDQTRLDANWSGGTTDTGSGWASYDWCFNEEADCVTSTMASGTTAGTTSFATGLTLLSDTWYHACVRSVDAVGNASAYVCSDGVQIVPTLTVAVTGYDEAGVGPANPIGFGSLSPGVDKTVYANINVITSSVRGYSISAHDPDGNGGMYDSVEAVTFPWISSGTVATPAAWSGSGMGISAYSGIAPGRWCSTANAPDCTSHLDPQLLFAPLTGAAQVLATSSSPTTGQDTRVAMRANASLAQAAGSYGGDVIYTITTNP